MSGATVPETQIAPISNLQITDLIARGDMFKAVGLADGSRRAAHQGNCEKRGVCRQHSNRQRYAGGGKNTVEGCRSIDVIGAAVSDRENRANLTFKAFKKLAASPWGRAGRARSGLGRGRVGM